MRKIGQKKLEPAIIPLGPWDPLRPHGVAQGAEKEGSIKILMNNDLSPYLEIIFNADFHCLA